MKKIPTGIKSFRKLREENYYFVDKTRMIKDFLERGSEVTLVTKTITEEIKNINGITFIWVTDGQGWNTAKHNLKETFDVLKHLYCIKDLGNGILETIIK